MSKSPQPLVGRPGGAHLQRGMAVLDLLEIGESGQLSQTAAGRETGTAEERQLQPALTQLS